MQPASFHNALHLPQKSHEEWLGLTHDFPWYPIGWIGVLREDQTGEDAFQHGLMHFQYPSRLRPFMTAESYEPTTNLVASEEWSPGIETETQGDKPLDKTRAEEEIDVEPVGIPETEDPFEPDPLPWVVEEIIIEEPATQSVDPFYPGEESGIPGETDEQVEAAAGGDDAIEVFDEIPEEENGAAEMISALPMPASSGNQHQQENEGKQYPAEGEPDETDMENAGNITSGEKEPEKPEDQKEGESPENGSVQPLLQLDLKAQPGGDGLSFQPYHTIDYFASQGVRIDPSLPPKTRFDRQLRSFTQWLKTMKPLENTPEPDAEEKKIPVIAEASNAQQEVITEAMAEVLLKQGKKHQAREVFEKLSLIHPEKNSYFAARIQELNA